MSEPTRNLVDDPVWSNWFYLLPVLTAPGFWNRALILLTGSALALASAAYHWRLSRPTQRWDVATMLTFLASIVAVLWAPVTTWAYLLVPVVGAIAFGFTWQINSYYAVPLLAVIGLGVLFYYEPESATGPAVTFAAGGAIKIYDPGVDTWLHSLWHFLGGVAAMWAFALL